MPYHGATMSVFASLAFPSIVRKEEGKKCFSEFDPHLTRSFFVLATMKTEEAATSERCSGDNCISLFGLFFSALKGHPLTKCLFFFWSITFLSLSHYDFNIQSREKRAEKKKLLCVVSGGRRNVSEAELKKNRISSSSRFVAS